ncbi:MAG TPA: 5'/3'-nucleotidase SurE [Anaerolineales bacterium]|nr:5'/3'-nucleotidase SurE [Anaerolineales bacterium]
MHILVTNDDGIHTPGLLALAQEMRQLGKVSVLAPDRNWSVSGHVKTLHRPLRIKETTLADGTPALMTDGAPSDCVALALLGHLEKVDLVLSGINPYANIGDDITYSGTVTAAMEAAIANIPGIAVSLHTTSSFKGERDYGPAARAARKVAERVIEKGLPPRLTLNVNVPNLPDDEIKGYAITRQGVRIYKDELIVQMDPKGKPFYWIGGEYPSAHMEDGHDYHAIENGYVSITPIQLDLTDYAIMPKLQEWEF